MERNNTSYPVHMTAQLRQLHQKYVKARADVTASGHSWAELLRYYQFTVRAFFSDELGGASGSRGLLCYHSMGLGKTRLAVAVAVALWDVRSVVVMLPRSLRSNFEKTVREVLLATEKPSDPDILDAKVKTALERFTFVSMDAYNSADQMARAGTSQKVTKRIPKDKALINTKNKNKNFPILPTGGLDGKLLIVDEAHNFFRAIINGGEDANARRNYDMIMGARDLRILFLTGTPASKDPFELVPCFNMLAGFNLLPTQYETFYDLYVDKGTNSVKNAEHLANRIIGLVSHVSTALPTEPKESDESETIIDMKCLWARTADLPIIDVPSSAFSQLLRDLTWDGEMGPSTLSAFEVVTNLAKYPHEHAKIAMADLKYPILIASAPGNLPPGNLPPGDLPPGDKTPLKVYDGMHRIARAVLIDGAASVRAVYVGPEIINECRLKAPTAKHVSRAARSDGWFPEEKPVHVELIEMGTDQYRQYLLAREREAAESSGMGSAGLGSVLASGPLTLPGAEKKAMSSYYVHSRSIENFCFPRGFADTPIDEIPLEELTDQLAPKLALIAKRAVDAPGPILVYSQFVDRGGLRPLTRYLRRQKFLDWREASGGQVVQDDRNDFIEDVQTLTSMIKNSPSGQVRHTVVYIGATPGRHIPYLASLFPTITWHLYDSAPSINGRPEELARIHTHKDSNAEEWRGRCDIFIDRSNEKIPSGTPRPRRLMTEASRQLMTEVPRQLMTEAPRQLMTESPRQLMTEAPWQLTAGTPSQLTGGAPPQLTAGAGTPPQLTAGAGVSPRRYAVISGEVSSEERQAIVQVFNSKENAHGELIKAILVSKTGAEGLDLKWIRETHQLEPYWDRARDDQVRARAVRLGSHDGLPIAEREVQPYIYVAIANATIWKNMPSSSREPMTIDEIFYERASRRYRLNQAFRNVLASACLECEPFGYNAFGFKCRTCVPTNAALWLPDPAADSRMPDSCELQTEQTIEAVPIQLDGQQYYYQADAESAYGYVFFEERVDLGAYAPIDPADPRMPQLVRQISDRV